MYEKYSEINKLFIEIIDATDMTNPTEEKRLMKYLEWVELQNKLFLQESKELNIPDILFKNKITSFEYDKHIRVLNKYYYMDPKTKQYIKRKLVISYDDKVYLLKHMLLIKGKVVWVDFGFNVGREFGGRHPAVILKNLGEVLIVAPIDSDKATRKKRDTQVEVPQIYDFPLMNRYTDIMRIVPVSVHRLCLDSPIGRIKEKNLREINSKVINNWQDLFSIYF